MSTRLKKLYDLLKRQLAEHETAGAEITVDLAEDGVYRLQSVESGSFGGDGVTIRYGGGKGKRPAHQLSFNEEESGSFRFGAREFFGLDEDGEQVRIRFSIAAGETAGGKSKPARSIKKTQAMEPPSGDGLLSGGKNACLPAHLARALVFRCTALDRQENVKSPWTRTFEGVSVSSEQGPLWQDHRWMLEYLVVECTKAGSLKLKVPAQKVVNALGMRYTANFVRFGMKALEALRDSVVNVVGSAGESATLRFVESFEWGADGSVKIELRPEAIATFKRPGDKKLAELLDRKSSEQWALVAGLLAGGSGVKFTRKQLEELEKIGRNQRDDQASEIWDMLTCIPEGGRWTRWDALWFDVHFYRKSHRAEQASGPRPHKPASWAQSFQEIVEDFNGEKQRMVEHIAAGGWLADESEAIAWRVIDGEVEFAAFHESGLQSVPEDMRHMVWK